MQAEEKKNYTPEEYLELEANSKERHEYLDGEIVLMPGGMPNHNRITLNLDAVTHLFQNFDALRLMPNTSYEIQSYLICIPKQVNCKVSWLIWM